MKKGDLVWVAGPGFLLEVGLVAQQVRVRSVGDIAIMLEEPASCLRHRVKVRPDECWPTSEEAILRARGLIRMEVARIEAAARQLCVVADAEPKLFPAAP